MTHIVTGLIAESAFLRRLAATHNLSPVVELNSVLSFLPLREDEPDTPFLVRPKSDGEGFQYLAPNAVAALSDASTGGTLLYFETEYFGGARGQGAAVFREGKLVFGPLWERIGPVNQALRLLGVAVKPPYEDEFETVGLGRYRTTDKWIAHAK